MSEKNNDIEWTRPVIETSNLNPETPNNSKTPKTAAWTTLAIGVVTKKILQNDAAEEYPFKANKE